MEEIWKDIIGYGGKYQISNHGRIKSVARQVFYTDKPPRYKKELILKSRPTGKRGKQYLMIALYDNKGVRKDMLIHRLVAKYFIFNDNPYNKIEVNHIDGDRNNGNVINLEWVTPHENMEHAKKIGLIGKGETHSRAKLTETQVIKLRTQTYKWGEKSRIAKKLNITCGTLCGIINGRYWKHLNKLA